MGFVGAGILLMRVAWPVFAGTPLLPLFGAIVAATQWGNRRAGILAIALGAGAEWLFIPPFGPQLWTPRVLIVFVGVGLLATFIVDGRNRARAELLASLDARRRAEQELRAKEEHLRRAQKTEAVARLVAGVAHNFNNLLTVTMGYAELLIERNGGREPDHGDLQMIHEAAERGASLTRQLLAFGRTRQAAVERIDTTAAIKGFGDLLARVVREDTRLEIAVAPEPAFVEIEPDDLQQVVLNLVLNARDALPGGGTIRVETATERIDAPGSAHGQSIVPGAYVRLQVQDNGSGMTPEAQAHLFEPFFTTKSVGEGTGLGLAFVFGIARQRRGFVTVETAAANGTTVAVHLPLAGPERAAKSPAPAAVAAAPHRRGATVLLVEDEDSVRSVTSGILSRAGYRVLAAATPGEASGIFDEHGAEIDLLVTDVVMPEMHGPALAQQFIARRPDLRVLFVSGYSDSPPLAAMAPGRSAFLAKPFAAPGLVRAADDLLN